MSAGATGTDFRSWSLFHVERSCCYLVFLSGFLGVGLFAINVGMFELFPYRVLMVILWALFAAQTLLQGKVAMSLGHVKLYMAFFGVWLVYALMSLGWAASKVDAIRDVTILFTSVSLVFFMIRYFREDQDLRNIYWIWFGAFCSLIPLGFWEHLAGQHLSFSAYYGETRSWLIYVPTGVFYNPNDYATFLALSIPFALVLTRYDKSRLIQIAGLGTAIAAFYLIVVTGSRSNILAVMLELLFLFIFLTNSRQKVKIAVAIVAYFGISFLLMSGNMQYIFSTVASELYSIGDKLELESGSVGTRINLVRNGLVFLYYTAGFGVGAGNAEYWVANFARYNTNGIINLHNWWLEVLVNYGIFIFAGYIAMYMGLIWGLLDSWRKARDSRERMVGEALLLALVGFSLASISSSSIMGSNPIWMLFAFSLMFLNLHRITGVKEA